MSLLLCQLLGHSIYTMIVLGTMQLVDTASPTMAEYSALGSRHPYYIRPCDHSGTQITAIVLQGTDNYYQWRHAVMKVLSTRNKLGFLDGTVAIPPKDSLLFSDYLCCNDMVISWLTNVLSSEISCTVMYIDTAKGIWDALATRFGENTEPRVFYLEQELAQTFQENLPAAYFGKLKHIWDELDNMKTIRYCTCTVSCQYHLDLDLYFERKKVMKFLMGLREDYTIIRGQVINMKPYPSLDSAYNMILREEGQRNYSIRSVPEAIALLAKQPFPRPTESSTIYKAVHQKKSAIDGTKQCTYCKKIGHTRYQCWKLIGYPPNHKLHTEPTEQQLRNRQKFAAANAVLTPSTVLTDQAQSSSTSSFTSAQLHEILALLKADKGGSSSPISPMTGRKKQHQICLFWAHHVSVRSGPCQL